MTNLIAILLLIILISYVIICIVKHPYRKCENPNCEDCPFPRCKNIKAKRGVKR